MFTKFTGLSPHIKEINLDVRPLHQLDAEAIKGVTVNVSSLPILNRLLERLENPQLLGGIKLKMPDEIDFSRIWREIEALKIPPDFPLKIEASSHMKRFISDFYPKLSTHFKVEAQ